MSILYCFGICCYHLVVYRSGSSEYVFFFIETSQICLYQESSIVYVINLPVSETQLIH